MEPSDLRRSRALQRRGGCRSVRSLGRLRHRKYGHYKNVYRSSERSPHTASNFLGLLGWHYRRTHSLATFTGRLVVDTSRVRPCLAVVCSHSSWPADYVALDGRERCRFEDSRQYCLSSCLVVLEGCQLRFPSCRSVCWTQERCSCTGRHTTTDAQLAMRHSRRPNHSLQRTASPPSVRASREIVSARCAPPAPPRPSLSLGR